MRGIRLLASELRGNQENSPSRLQIAHIRSEQFSTFVDRGVFQDMRKQDLVKEPCINTKKLLGRVRLEPTSATNLN